MTDRQALLIVGWSLGALFGAGLYGLVGQTASLIAWVLVIVAFVLRARVGRRV